MVARANDFYGIPDRKFTSEESKARNLNQEQLALVRDENVRMSLELGHEREQITVVYYAQQKIMLSCAVKCLSIKALALYYYT